MSRYEMKETPVGQGGFGKVRQGKDKLLDRKVAVKVLDPARIEATAEDKERFRREAKILATLQHPSIPAIYDVVFEEDKLEIVFQFIEGMTLRKIIADDDSVRLEPCRGWFDQLASALEHAHERGIIHRDVKPENIIISPDHKHCYLVDFGIALSKSERQRLTDPNHFIGTEGYMSPEQLDGDDVDGSDDVYVLGLCLYEALSGHTIAPGEYQPLSTSSELIPPSIDALIQRCIAPKPRRLRTATEFRNLLRQAFQKDRPLSEVLSSGALHELGAVIAQMSAAQFMELTAGQKFLILQRCADTVASAERDGKFTSARNEFLALMTPLGIHLNPEQFKTIVTPALRLGLGASTLDEPYVRGVWPIRDALVSAAAGVMQPNHHAIFEVLSGWLETINVDNQKAGLYHSLRLLLNTLMANPECKDDDALVLAKLLAQINERQRSLLDHNVDERQVPLPLPVMTT